MASLLVLMIIQHSSRLGTSHRHPLFEAKKRLLDQSTHHLFLIFFFHCMFSGLFAWGEALLEVINKTKQNPSGKQHHGAQNDRHFQHPDCCGQECKRRVRMIFLFTMSSIFIIILCCAHNIY